VYKGMGISRAIDERKLKCTRQTGERTKLTTEKKQKVCQYKGGEKKREQRSKKKKRTTGGWRHQARKRTIKAT